MYSICLYNNVYLEHPHCDGLICCMNYNFFFCLLGNTQLPNMVFILRDHKWQFWLGWMVIGDQHEYRVELDFF